MNFVFFNCSVGILINCRSWFKGTPMKPACKKYFLSSGVTFRFLSFTNSSNTSPFISSVIFINTLLFLSIDTVNASFCGACLLDTEPGGVISTASDGLNCVANMKKVNNRNATSHIAVISTVVLPRFILALPIIYFLIIIRFISLKFPQKPMVYL